MVREGHMRINLSRWVTKLAAVTSIVVLLSTAARCEIIANSIDDWSPDGEQGANGWTYGYFNSSLDGDPFEPDGYGYATDSFIAFDDEPDDWAFGTGWDSTLGNVPWTFVAQESGHPNGDNNGDVHFAMRRWESTFDGTAYLTSNLAKQNLNCGNGTSVHLYHNGAMIDEVRVPGGQAEFSTSTVEATLATGDIIDFGLSSLGPDDSFADGCDGSFFNLEISDTAPLPPPPPPEVIASSRDDWSADGEQGVNGWTYGYFNVSLDGDPLEDGFGYTTDGFINFEDELDDWTYDGAKWDSTLGNVPWTEISQAGGHPNGDNNGDIHFAIRRWESDTDGDVEITSSLSKTNTNCGNGTSVHVYINGELVDTITVASDQAAAEMNTIAASIASGDIIDFALSPLGIDDTFNDGCDGSSWGLEIVSAETEGVPGDFNNNGARDTMDLDLLATAMMDNNLDFDLNEDGVTDFADRKFWLEDLTNTFVGDSNFDGEFSSADFVKVFTAAKYETGQEATWDEGDWNGDKQFSSTDFVVAFQGAGYENGPNEGGLQEVPEPASFALAMLGFLALFGVNRRR